MKSNILLVRKRVILSEVYVYLPKWFYVFKNSSTDRDNLYNNVFINTAIMYITQIRIGSVTVA